MNTKVKICGIRTYEHAHAAASLGADFLGFVFVPNTKDFIEPTEAKEIIDELRIKNYELTIKFVGVFQDQDVEEVNRISNMLGLDFVQLHGEESLHYISQISVNVIKRITLHLLQEESRSIINQELRKLNLDKVKYFILDRKVQGQGDMVDLEKAKEVSETFPTFFAGGLTPENVSNVVSYVCPFAVDVCSGVMTNHVEDAEKIKKFIENAKSVFIEDSGQARMTIEKEETLL